MKIKVNYTHTVTTEEMEALEHCEMSQVDRDYVLRILMFVGTIGLKQRIKVGMDIMAFNKIRDGIKKEAARK